MKKVIGRESEKRQLEAFYHSDKAEFLAIYGRRRIGKTFLIQEFCASKDDICFHVTGLKDGNLRDQITNFTKVIGKTFYGTSDIKPKTNWLDAFEQLTEAMNNTVKGNKKIILFLDELPWMATKRSKLIQVLDHYWNRYWSIDSRVRLIVCGSSASWILEKLVHSKGGLYNRITYQIELSPFSLHESKKFLMKKNIKLTEKQVVKLYMVMGGIPLYLDHIQKGLSADQNIDQLCFTKRGLLFNEFNKLFESLFEQHDIHEELVRTIAQHRYGIPQTQLMRQSSKHTGGRLKKRLSELEDTGFIESFIPSGHNKHGIHYRVIDEYTLFYLKWINPIADSIRRRSKDSGYWLSREKSSSWESWSGYAFEAICYKHISQIRQTLDIPPGFEVGAWSQKSKNTEERGAQIDMVFDRDDDVITLCEIKYNEKPFVISKDYAKVLLNKIAIYKKYTKTDKQIFLSLIAAGGVKDSAYADEIIDKLVTLKNLFQDS